MGARAKPPLILDIKRNSLDDGPGIRTVVLFKGCPLDCVWCHNPESKKVGAELAFREVECIACGTCQDGCPEGAIVTNRVDHVDRSACQRCFTCAQSCPTEALSRVGEALSVEEVLSEIEKDITFFRNSGGGVTLSGGEPTLYNAFCSELLTACRERGISTLLETCGHFAADPFFATLHPHLDHVYVDIKLIDPEAHRRFCGVDNRLIIENIRRLAAAARDGRAAVLPRVPLVPGITDTDANLRGIAAFLRDVGFDRVSLLPYNPTWHDKARSVGRPSALEGESFMSAAQLEHCRSFFEGFEVVR